MSRTLNEVNHLWIAIGLFLLLLTVWLFKPTPLIESLLGVSAGVVFGALRAELNRPAGVVNGRE